MKSRKHTLAFIVACTLAGTWTGAAFAQAASAPKPIVTDASDNVVNLSVSGEIVAVDPAARTVDIKGPRGNVATYTVDPKVKNFDQVKVGDQVRLDYRTAVALALLKGGNEIREKVEAQSVAVAPEGAKPGGAAMKRTTIVANVENVDRKRKVATLKGPSGRVVDVVVNDPQLLKDLKVGDQVVANVTESVAINVQPAKAK